MTIHRLEKMKPSKKIEKVQLVLPPPRRQDAYVTRLTQWPGPFTRYARKAIFRMAEMAVSSEVFASALQRLVGLQIPWTGDSYTSKYARWPQPLGILSIATYIKQNNPGVEVEILDGNNILGLDEIKRRIDAELVGISTTALGYDHAIEVARAAKKKGALVVLGGAAATPLAREILKYYEFVDAVIRYDGELAFSKYVAGATPDSIENLVYRENSGIRKNPVVLPPLDMLPPPDRELLDMERYFRNSQHPTYPICEPFKRPVNIYSQKGCMWRSQPEGGCVFCAIPYYNLRLRDPGQVWGEIAGLAGKHDTDFVWDTSDNLVGDRKWFRAFCAAKPAQLKIHYTSYVDADDIDEETARLLAETGCVSVFVGMESGDPQMLKSMNKKATVDDNIRAMELLGKHRIGVIAGVVLGVQGESRDSLERTVSFLKRVSEFDNFDRFEWGSLTPFPGSRANSMLREHPGLRNKYRHFGDRNYLFQLAAMIQD